MIIGNFKGIRGTGVQAKLNKWYFGVEILPRPRTMCRIFKPDFFFLFVKWQDFGEPYRSDGKPEKKIGGWKHWTFPWGITIEIHR